MLNDAIDSHRTIRDNGLFYESHVREQLERFVPQSRVMYDIGANIGIHTVSAKQINPALRVFCFDPVWANHQLLLSTIGLNAWPDVHAVPVALGDADGMIGINEDPTNATCGSHGQYYPRWATMFRLDSFDFPMPQLVKIDIEGCELAMMHGATKMLAARPVIISEFNLPLLQPKGIAEEYIEFFLSRNYVVHCLNYQPGMQCRITSGVQAVQHVLRTSGAIADIIAEPL